MPSINGNSLIARNYRAKHPDMPTKKLARIMYAENNLAFINEERARSSLRYIEGKNGSTHRNVNRNEFRDGESIPAAAD